MNVTINNEKQNTTTQKVMSFLKLKNSSGEDIYSIDKLGETLIISQVKREVNIFEPLIIYGENGDNMGIFNLSTIFIDELTNAIDGLDIDTKKPKKLSDISLKAIDTLVKYKTGFRKLNECFPYGDNRYRQPDAETITKDIDYSDKEIGLFLNIDKVESKQDKKSTVTYVRETPKVGANDPCHCGKINEQTGEPMKYKKCCKLKGK